MNFILIFWLEKIFSNVLYSWDCLIGLLIIDFNNLLEKLIFCWFREERSIIGKFWYIGYLVIFFFKFNLLIFGIFIFIIVILNLFFVVINFKVWLVFLVVLIIIF